MRSARLLRIDREACLSLERSLQTEWLETDGRGGYASSSVLFCPTRRYHGLLVAVPPGSSKRHVFLSRFEEHVRRGEQIFPLSLARYPGTFAPLGHQGIESFELVPWPRASYRVGGVLIRREVQLVRGAALALVRYEISAAEGGFELEVRPLLAFREADALTFRNEALDQSTAAVEGGLVFRPYPALPALHLCLGEQEHSFTPAPVWYSNLEYPTDLGRGYDGHEDQYSPGILRVALRAGEGVVIAASLDGPVADPQARWREAAARRVAEVVRLEEQSPAHARLWLGAEDFLMRSPGGRLAVDAGFPWFGEWGRDAFISLPGLTLARDRLEDCTLALSGALEYLRDGLLPNVFGKGKEDSDYGSADASLWFARAVRLWEQAGGSRDLLFAEFVPALVEIAESYARGTGLGIAADEAGLIHVGSADLNSTWMDARIDGVPVTPRDGFPVEINALWYSLLQHLEVLFSEREDRGSKEVWSRRRREVKRSFLRRFWLEERGYLADRWKDGAPDLRVRPNMVIAAALELSPLSRVQRQGVVRRAEAELLTPKGLRTLSPRDPGYRGKYAGGSSERDAAYHQGTVWPWLLGFYVEARLRSGPAGKKESAALRSLWSGLEEELDRAGLNHVSEVFDGDPPHEPGGTIAQAWNTAEYLRSLRLIESGR